EIPSPAAGVVKKMLVGVGDKVSEGSPIALLEVEEEEAAAEAAKPQAPEAEAAPADRPSAPPPGAEAREHAPPAPTRTAAAQEEPAAEEEAAAAEPALRDLAPYSAEGTAVKAHASPSVRRLARELGVDLDLVPGTGRKGRILQEDVQAYVKA